MALCRQATHHDKVEKKMAGNLLTALSNAFLSPEGFILDLHFIEICSRVPVVNKPTLRGSGNGLVPNISWTNDDEDLDAYMLEDVDKMLKMNIMIFFRKTWWNTHLLALVLLDFFLSPRLLKPS